MFGVGIFEVLVILIVAVIALGPNKLPQTIVDIVKFFRAVKKTMAEAKETFDKEIQLSEIKQEALKYKDTLESEVNKLTKDIRLDELREISVDSLTKPLQETKEVLSEEAKNLQSTLESLNSDISYESSAAAQTPTIQESIPTDATREIAYATQKPQNSIDSINSKETSVDSLHSPSIVESTQSSSSKDS
ncbi:Sec-independent protein translocase subunit TatB [Helicobacter sp. MIT 03-1614]|uniref:Sec-independent protein translocase protein TatB n=1 Tax=unclassified Helicobacter TaxID=2593540 RepID=UPI000512A545|nr:MULTISPECIES: Sec-independent protein translocase protein TatB [unclassified Helicobacter]TLD89043.1 Sec-independent protein translocase subunit TatB [Helicobacter sp. MIT 03-1614]